MGKFTQKKCYECKTTHSERWFKYTMPMEDGFGIACSEPGVPTTIDVPIDICEQCEELANNYDTTFENI